MQYFEVGSENINETYALTAGAGEDSSYGFAVFVVNNNEMIVPTLDEQDKLTGWSKVVFDRLFQPPGQPMTLFVFNVRESDLENLIGESVKE